MCRVQWTVYLWASVFSFHRMGPRDWTETVRFGGKHLYPLSHLAGPGLITFKRNHLFLFYVCECFICTHVYNVCAGTVQVRRVLLLTVVNFCVGSDHWTWVLCKNSKYSLTAEPSSLQSHDNKRKGQWIIDGVSAGKWPMKRWELTGFQLTLSTWIKPSRESDAGSFCQHN